MRIVSKNRGEGKTTELVKRSAETGYPILCCKAGDMRGCILKAKELGVTIPEPILYCGKDTFKGLKDNKYIIDELEFFISNILGVEIDTVSINKEKVIDGSVTSIEIDNDFEKTKQNLMRKYEVTINNNDFGTGLNILKNLEYINNLTK